MPTLKIDGKEITAAEGVTVLQAALANGIEIPHYCYHPALTIVGSCRMCLVEIDHSPKLVLSCATPVRDGMVVATQTEQVKDARKSMLEFFLINHPLDCPVCDKAGECILQDYTYTYGSSHSRMVEDKRERQPKDLGGNILLYRNRCILCSRCVRFYEDVVGDPHLIVENRGYHSDISIFPGKGLTHKMTGNIVEICPVGCLIDKDFLFQARVWNLQKTNSICPGCSSGCNIYLEHKDHRVFRIRSRENSRINKEWICDEGRYIYHQYENLSKSAGPVKRKSGVQTLQTWQQAIEEAAATLRDKKKNLAVVGSGFATLEENYMLRKIFKDTLACDNFFVRKNAVQKPDIVYRSGFTIRGDKSPNSRGAKMVLGRQIDFYKVIETGQITHLFILGGDPRLNLSEKQKRILQKLKELWVLDIQENELTALAHHFWPMACFMETQGVYINAQGQAQRLQPAMQPLDEVKPGWQILLQLLKVLAPETALHTASDVLNDLAATMPAFRHISFFKLGDQGLPIDTR